MWSAAINVKVSLRAPLLGHGSTPNKNYTLKEVKKLHTAERKKIISNWDIVQLQYWILQNCFTNQNKQNSGISTYFRGDRDVVIALCSPQLHRIISSLIAQSLRLKHRCLCKHRHNNHTGTQTPHHHPSMLVSDKTSRLCFERRRRQCEAPLPQWLMNWQKLPASSAKQWRVSTIQPWHLLPSQEGPSLLHAFLFSFSLFSIYSSSLFQDLVFLLDEQHVSNYLRAIHYKWHPPHCTAEIFWVQKKMGFAFTLCSYWWKGR